MPRSGVICGPGALRDGLGKTEGAGCRGCVASFLSPDDSDRRGAAIAKLLDRIVRVLELLERNDSITLETIALFIRFWLTSMPALPEQSSPAACAKGAERYDRFVETLWPAPLQRIDGSQGGQHRIPGNRKRGAGQKIDRQTSPARLMLGLPIGRTRISLLFLR